MKTDSEILNLDKTIISKLPKATLQLKLSNLNHIFSFETLKEMVWGKKKIYIN